jgi:hypothetical protein
MALFLPGKPEKRLFHTMDKLFKPDNIVQFQFHPKNASEAHNCIAGLVHFLRDGGHLFHLKMFSAEALQRHASSKWDPVNMEVGTIEEAHLLADDDDLNFTDEPTHKKPGDSAQATLDQDFISMNVPVISENFPTMHSEDSVSTFHPNKGRDVVCIDDEDTTTKSNNERQPYDDPDTISKISDTTSRISLLESDILDLNKHFRMAFDELQRQARQQEAKQLHQENTLEEILMVLKSGLPTTQLLTEAQPKATEAANTPQELSASDPNRAAGHC